MRLQAQWFPRLLTVVSCAVVLGVPSLASASFDLTPITATLAPSGARAITSFTVTNQGMAKLPVQLSIVPREPDILGNEVYKESDDVDALFQIYPAQIILGPLEKRTVRVSWVGTPKVTREIPFRIIAEELPFDVEDNSKSYKTAVGRVRVASRYIGSIYITPVGAQPKLVAKGELVKGPEPKLNLDIENAGSVHQVLGKMKVKLVSVSGKASVEVSQEQLRALLSQNILAGKTRRFTMPWPKGIPMGPVKVSLEAPQD